MLDKIKSNLDTVTDKLTGLVFNEVECPVYIINQSADPNHYELAFDFTEVILTMNESKLPKPVITVWGGRNDFDKDLLSNNIKSAFVDQFEQAKHDLGKSRNDVSTSIQNFRDNKLSFSLTAIVAMLFIANPIVDLLLLIFAFTSGKDAVLAQLNLFKNAFKNITNSDDNKEIITENQEKELISAIKKLDIKIQKDLYINSYSFGNEAGSLKGVDYKHQLPSFVNEMYSL